MRATVRVCVCALLRRPQIRPAVNQPVSGTVTHASALRCQCRMISYHHSSCNGPNDEFPRYASLVAPRGCLSELQRRALRFQSHI
eukprot:5811949-Amphidinium_carterae.1